MGNFILVVILLFVFMVMVLECIGVVKDFYCMMYLWWGGLCGGLVIGILGICVIFVVMCGIFGVVVVVMGIIVLLFMFECGYDKCMVFGCINIGGGWGILILFSILMIFYLLIIGVLVG